MSQVMHPLIPFTFGLYHGVPFSLHATHLPYTSSHTELCCTTNTAGEGRLRPKGQFRRDEPRVPVRSCSRRVPVHVHPHPTAAARRTRISSDKILGNVANNEGELWERDQWTCGVIRGTMGKRPIGLWLAVRATFEVLKNRLSYREGHKVCLC